MDINFQHSLWSVAQSKAANLQCTFHRTNTRKRRSAPKSLMDSEHLADGSFPKDEKSMNTYSYTAQRSTGSKSLSTLDTFSACMRCVGVGFCTFHLKSVQT